MADCQVTERIAELTVTRDAWNILCAGGLAVGTKFRIPLVDEDTPESTVVDETHRTTLIEMAVKAKESIQREIEQLRKELLTPQQVADGQQPSALSAESTTINVVQDKVKENLAAQLTRAACPNSHTHQQAMVEAASLYTGRTGLLNGIDNVDRRAFVRTRITELAAISMDYGLWRAIAKLTAGTVTETVLAEVHTAATTIAARKQNLWDLKVEIHDFYEGMIPEDKTDVRKAYADMIRGLSGRNTIRKTFEARVLEGKGPYVYRGVDGEDTETPVEVPLNREEIGAFVYMNLGATAKEARLKKALDDQTMTWKGTSREKHLQGLKRQHQHHEDEPPRRRRNRGRGGGGRGRGKGRANQHNKRN